MPQLSQCEPCDLATELKTVTPVETLGPTKTLRRPGAYVIGPVAVERSRRLGDGQKCTLSGCRLSRKVREGVNCG